MAQTITELQKLSQIIRTQNGAAATIEIGTVESGEEASVTNSGTKNAAVLNFVLPKGDAGEDGQGITSITYNGDGTLTLTYGDGSTVTTGDLKGETGATGADGHSVTVTATKSGTTTTVTFADATTGTVLATATIEDGANGSDGDDGHSVTVTATKNGTTTTVVFSDAVTGTVLATATIEDGQDGSDADPVYTNSGKKLTHAQKVTSGNANMVSLTDEDDTNLNVYGLPGGAAAGAYLKSDGTLAGSTWQAPDTTPTSGSTALITSGAVYAAIQGAINASY